MKDKFTVKILSYLFVLGVGAYAGTKIIAYKPTWFGLADKKILAGSGSAQAIVNKVGALMALPGDETPVIKVFTESMRVENPELYKNAQPGDNILIYQNSGKSIIFRPGEDKIIDAGVSATPTASPIPTIAPTKSPEPTGKPEDLPSASPSQKPSSMPVPSIHPTPPSVTDNRGKNQSVALNHKHLF